VKITVAVEIGKRTVIEHTETTEDYRGDYREAVSEIISRIELGTYGPQIKQEGYMFDSPLQMKPQT
jgi:hypothetical protein